MVDGSDNLIDNLLAKLTGDLADISSNSKPFNGGPLGQIDGVLENFNLGDFATYLLDDFKSLYQAFAHDLVETDHEFQSIIEVKPKLLSSFIELPQLGSKKPSVQYSMRLRAILWDKLVSTFPSPLYNGVKIPGLDRGQSFVDRFPIRGSFPVESFLPLIAVAYGKATSFSDEIAQSFTLKSLFATRFGPDLSSKLLGVLKANVDLLAIFNRFNDFDSYTGMPWDPNTKEIFDVERFIPEILYAFDLSTSVEFTATNFHASELFAAFYPRAMPSLKSFAKFVKAKIVKDVTAALGGLFQDDTDTPTPSDLSTRLFPPRTSIDDVQVSSSPRHSQIRRRKFSLTILPPLILTLQLSAIRDFNWNWKLTFRIVASLH